MPQSAGGIVVGFRFSGHYDFLSSHILVSLSKRPVVCLLLLAPQVEYLTGSTQLSSILLNPPLFLIFLALNLGSYGAAVLLIREASISWKKGWASILILGAAYGIVNEGIGAGTLFNPSTMNSGNLGVYGHWLGVNWINVAILIPIVHPLYSVSLPILHLGVCYSKRWDLCSKGSEVASFRNAPAFRSPRCNYSLDNFLCRRHNGPLECAARRSGSRSNHDWSARALLGPQEHRVKR